MSDELNVRIWLSEQKRLESSAEGCQRWCRDVTSDGRQFHTRGPATENARLPTVERWTGDWVYLQYCGIYCFIQNDVTVNPCISRFEPEWSNSQLSTSKWCKSCWMQIKKSVVRQRLLAKRGNNEPRDRLFNVAVQMNAVESSDCNTLSRNIAIAFGRDAPGNC